MKNYPLQCIFMLLLFTGLLSFSKNSSACDASFVDSVYGNTVQFINTSQGGYPTYFWDFGDNTTSSLENPVHQYADTGDYVVCLVIVDFFNNCNDTTCQLVVVGNNGGGCNAYFTYSDSSGTAYFSNGSQASNSAYWFWSFGDGTASDLENPTHQFNGFGPYYVCLTVYDTANNCSDTYCENVYLLNNGGGCQAYFTYSANGLSVDFTNLSAGNYTSVIWDFGDNSGSYFNNPSHTYSASGYYYVCVTVSDTGVFCNDTYCQYIYVNDSSQCHSTFAYTANGNNLQFVNYSSSGGCNDITWYWWFGDGSSSSNYDPSHLYANSGVYTVCLSMYDANCGCSDSTCMDVYAGNNNVFCSASFALYPDSSQQGLYWGYNYSTGSNLTYFWSWGDGTSSTGPYPSHMYSDSGYYTICLTILDTVSQCTDTYCSNYYILKQAKLDQIHEVIFVNATGVPPVNGDEKIEWSIYPNPASDNMRITTNAGEVEEIKITDVNGKVVKEIFNYNGKDIELKSLMQEVYIVQSLINGNWSSKLLIKQ